MVSHQEQSRLHPEVRMNSVGAPIIRPSPWIDTNVSHIFIVSLVIDLVLESGLFEAFEPQPAGIAVAAGLLSSPVA